MTAAAAKILAALAGMSPEDAAEAMLIAGVTESAAARTAAVLGQRERA